MADRRSSFIKELMKRMRKERERGFRFFGKEEKSKDFWSPFDEIMRDLEESSPEKLEDFFTEEETPHGKAKKYGPFVYGFSYSKKPGEEPEFREFGNIRPGGPKGVEKTPEGEREPLTEITDLNGKYEVIVWLPGAKKDEIELSATEKSMKVAAEGERQYLKDIPFKETIDPDKVDANFKHGILSVEIDKRGKEEKEGKKIDIE